MQRLLVLTLLALSQGLQAETSPTAPAAAAPVTPPPAAPTAVNNTPPAPASKDEVADLNAQRDKLAAEIALGQARLDKELSASKANTARLQAELAEMKAKQDLEDYKTKQAVDKELATTRRALDKATLESSLSKALVDTQFNEIRQIENTPKKESAKISANIELAQRQLEGRSYASADPIYLKDPVQGGRLIISDRRISLNGPITMTTADFIAERINYFDNRDRTLPIFLVIDDSPGGSVMAGYKILKAMHGSEAPVYVVVKSFAASMAACITTQAAKSFAYPNAVILHHQIQSFGGGNLTQQQEWVKEMEEWWRRLADPVAQKMGITRDEFIKKMYAHSSTGDWNEFADNAQKLHWVDQIVDQIEETGTVRDPEVSYNAEPRKFPTGPSHENMVNGMTEQKDEKGHAYVTLPSLNPFDCYWLYNPNGYYRLP
jgi:ATP-dependent Clp protease protease subunit